MLEDFAFTIDAGGSLAEIVGLAEPGWNSKAALRETRR